MRCVVPDRRRAIVAHAFARCAHLAAAERIWLARFEGRRPDSDLAHRLDLLLIGSASRADRAFSTWPPPRCRSARAASKLHASAGLGNREPRPRAASRVPFSQPEEQALTLVHDPVERTRLSALM
jgi:hypothetical protein